MHAVRWVMFALMLFAAAAFIPSRSESNGDGTISVVGVLTSEGAECQALRGDDGELYTLARGNMLIPEVGARVRVKGTVAEISICQQGITINVTEIAPAE